MRSIMRLGVVAGAVVLALGACGGDDNDDAIPTPDVTAGETTGDDGGEPVTNAAACRLITAEEATELFGGAEARATPDAAPINNATSTCIWGAEDAKNHSYLLQVRVFDGEQFYGDQAFDDEQPVDGLGEKAFVRTEGGIAGVDIQWVNDGKVYVVNYGITNVLADGEKDAVAQADELLALVKANQSRV